MTKVRPSVFSDRYLAWQEHSPLQRHFLHICTLSLAVLGVVLLSDDFAYWLLHPFESALRWLIGPPSPPVPDPRGPEFDASPFVGNSQFYVVGRAAFLSACVVTLVSSFYWVAIVLNHVRTRATTRRKDRLPSVSDIDSSDSQSN
jgi:hypothetical protein